MSLSGGRAIVGAWGGDDAGTDSGSAYVYQRTGSLWVEEDKLIASDAAAGDLFRRSVSISGDFAIVGANFSDDNGSSSGSAYVYHRTGSLWVEEDKFIASDAAADDEFGRSVSVSGNRAIVGAVLNDTAGTDSGSAYIFDISPLISLEVSLHTSCLAGNGRLDVNLLNTNSVTSLYELQFEGLSPRQRQVGFEDWGRIRITGRPAGDYTVAVTRDSETVVTETVSFNCDAPVPSVSTPEVTVMSACRSGLGQVFFQMVNPTSSAKPYIIEFEGVANRSTTAAAYGQARRGTTGRPDGAYDYLVKSGSTVVDQGVVTVDCS